MFMITNLITPCMGKLILNHLIENNCLEFRNGFLGSYFFKLTLGSYCLELASGQSLSKPSCLSNITKIPIAFKQEPQTNFGAYAVFTFNP